MREDQKLQAACGAGTQILSVQEIADRYPFYSLDDIRSGSLNTKDEGAFDAFGMVRLFAGALKNRESSTYTTKSLESLVMVATSDLITLETGEVIQVGVLVDAAGTRAAEISGLAGVELPIEARRRYTYIFSVDEPLPQDLPLTIDPIGVHMRSYGENDYLVGCPPIGPDLAVDPADFTYPEDVWTEKMLPVLKKRIPQFSTARVTDSWVGHYEFNTFDHNAIIGPHTE